MLKKLFVLIIILLIISTTFIKNYTKKLDEKIFTIRENINYLNNIEQLVLLEHNYLSSPDRLIELKHLYFEEEFEHTSANNLEIISNIKSLDLKTKNDF